MWIVKLALNQPHTFIVMAVCIFLFGIVSLSQMAIDIFPTIDEPVVSCVWTYTGMPPSEIERYITSVTERAFTSTVAGIDHMDSMSLNGMSIIKVYLHQGASIAQAVAQVASTSEAVKTQLPSGINPPFVTQSSATDVPILQLLIASSKLGEAELFDLANEFIRVQLAVVQGATIPFPNGGKYRQVCVDINPQSLVGLGLDPTNVVDAINSASIIAPSGTAKMGRCEYIVTLNNMPDVIDKLNNVPVKHLGSATVYVKDVAYVHDGAQPQLNVVNKDGQRSVIMNILKNGSASTLTVVDLVKKILPNIRLILPPSASIEILTDQSKFVSECVAEVVQETITAAGLTAIFMLAILGSWRSTVIVITSIPLALLCSVIGLKITGNTINSMTLGGLALAVGMLVDDATVEIENVHRQLDMHKTVVQAILDGAEEVALPAMVSTLSICIVFLPTFLLSEPSRSLFVPLGLAVTFAMLASYGLSRTIVPLMSKKLFQAEEHLSTGEQESSNEQAGEGTTGKRKAPGFFLSIHQTIDRGFNWLRDSYHGVLEVVLRHRAFTACVFLVFYGLSFCFLPFIGGDYFPPIDAGQLRLHLTCPAGTRVEQTERIFRSVEESIKDIIPAHEIELLTDNIGVPVSGVNYAFSDCQTLNEFDGEILITLAEHRSHSTWNYQRKIRELLTSKYPECSYYFQPADIITQILTAGVPAPIDIKITGLDTKSNYDLALDLKRKVQNVRGAVDVCLHQVENMPKYFFEVDQTRANQLGLTQNDASQALLVNLSSSFQVSPNFWVNPENGVEYYLQTLTPQYRISSLNDINNLSIGSLKSQANTQIPVQLLSNIATPVRQYTPAVVNHLNVQPCFDVYAACQSRDLAGVAHDIEKVVQGSKVPRGSTVKVSGEVLSMETAFSGLTVGLIGALVLVYLLLVVNFQSWVDPLIILMAVPGALAGILWSLFVSQTTLSVPALMGAIMTIGVASANSILMITFCNEQMHAGKSAMEAASMAGFQRFRPVCMTAMAMILGMIPMSMSTGMNAPIGRAVIGGLSVATFSTLLFVPLIFSFVKEKFPPKENIDHV
jgi:multidrug efflux pump subunit AcrB